MLPSLRFLIPCLVVCASLTAQTYNVTFEKKVGYNGWATGWDTVHVAKNDIVSIAIVPKLGGRVMQYNLGTNRSLFIYDSSEIPSSGDDIVGGFRVLPSPQSDFQWPSPPKLDFNPYTCTEKVNNADSVVMYLESQVENSTGDKYKTHQGLQFKRLITLYKASSRVKVEMTMLNKGTQSLTHGLWDITQTACPSDTDCWVYFKRNPSSTLGGGKGYVHYLNEGDGADQFNPDAAEGKIMGVQFKNEKGKIGADCKAGWICFNDRRTGYAYVKTFTYQENKTYPDTGASVQVYTYDSPNMMEVEVLGPLVTLAAGDSTKLVENWFAARSYGPVLDVNTAGLVTKKLKAQQTADSVTLSGTFGVFYPGKVKTQFCNATGVVVATTDSAAVLPTDSLRVNKKLGVPSGAVGIRLVAFNAAGVSIGTLDSTAVPNPTAVVESRGVAAATRHSLEPVITRTAGLLTVGVPFDGLFTTNVYSVNGKRVASFAAKAPYRHVIDVTGYASNMLVVKIAGPGFTGNRMVFEK